jgi:hypothetical protein
VKNRVTKCRKVRAKQVLLLVGGWEDLTVGDVELAQELDNRKCKYTFGFLTLCPCCTNF